MKYPQWEMSQPWHFYTMLLGDRLDWYPDRCMWRYRTRTHHGSMLEMHLWAKKVKRRRSKSADG